MIRIDRQWTWPDPAIIIRQTEWRSPLLHAFRMEHQGISHSEWTRPAGPGVRRRTFWVQRGWVDVPAVFDDPGDGPLLRVPAGALAPAGDWRRCRLVANAPHTVILQVAWAGDASPCSRLPERDGPQVPELGERTALAALADAMLEHGAAPLAALTPSERQARLLAALAVMAPADEPLDHLRGVQDATVLAQDQELADAIAALTCRLDHQPTLQDLADALGVSVRVASGRAVDWFRRYHLTVDGWRSYVSRLRLELGRTLVQHPDVRTADLAEWLGFRSAEAMFHAFRREGMAAPVRRYRGGVPASQ